MNSKITRLLLYTTYSYVENKIKILEWNERVTLEDGIKQRCRAGQRGRKLHRKAMTEKWDKID